METTHQLQFFGLPPEPQGALGAAARRPELDALGAALPAHLYLGTSSWSFPGWQGLVYDRHASSEQLARQGLRAYAKHPLFRSVGVDRGYYAPLKTETFAQYASSVPDDFRFLVKALQDLTLFRFPRQARYGAQQGQLNPRFLDAAYARDLVVAPFVEGLGERAGPLLFQFAPFNSTELGGPPGFAERLHAFLSSLPRGPLYAVEVRNAELLGLDYQEALLDLDCSHCLNAHPRMPGVEEQARLMRRSIQTAPALVCRWMLGTRLNYQEAKERYAPFDRLIDEDPATREAIAAEARTAGRPAYVIVNNKAEGSSPLSIERLARALVER